MFDWKKLGQLGPEEPQDPFAGMDPMVVEHIKKKMGGVDAAQKQADNAQMAGLAAQAGDMLANAANKPVRIENRMQDLGKAPAMLEGRQQKTDMSGIQRSAQHGLDVANQDRDQALQMMLAERKSQLAAQVQAKRQGVEDERYERNFAAQQQERDRAEQHRKVMEGKTKQTDPLMEMLRMQQLQKITKENNQPPKMPVEDQKVVETLATKNAGKISIGNQIESYLKEFQSAPDEVTKLRIGGQMLKVLNSPEGADAIGVEEAKRLGDALEFQVFNVLGAGPMFGRDLPGFEKQTKGTLDAVRGGVKANQDEISRITGRGQQQAPAAQTNKPQTIRQNGHTYTLNPQTGEYE